MCVIDIIIKAGARECPVQVDTSITVAELRDVVAIETNIPNDKQRLVYSGRVLRDEELLEQLGIKDRHTIYVVHTPSATAGTSSPPAPLQAAARSPTASPAASAPFAQVPPGGMSSFTAMQQQLLDNPELMRQVMDSPMMQAMMDNPELLRSMMMSNPQMQAIIEQNPELAHVLNDPANLRQSLQLMRNPQLMLEMQRNTDRAMQRIELMPGGFSALRRMYTDIAAPLESAAASQLSPSNSATSSVYSALLANSAQPPADRPNDVALPNPWAPPPATPSAPAATPGGSGMPFSGFTMPTMAPGGPDMAALLDNPQLQAMMSSVMANPDMMEAVLQMNPHTRAMLEANPQLRDVFRNPSFLRTMADPSVVRGILEMQRMGVGVPSMGDPAAAGMPSLAALFGGPAGVVPPQTAPTQAEIDAAGDRFASQLAALEEMGLLNDRDEAIIALLSTDGDLSAAVERLLGGRR